MLDSLIGVIKDLLRTYYSEERKIYRLLNGIGEDGELAINICQRLQISLEDVDKAARSLAQKGKIELFNCDEAILAKIEGQYRWRVKSCKIKS